MPISLHQLTQQIVRSGLMSAEQIDQLIRGLSPSERPADGEALLQLLIRKELINRFQAGEIASETGRSLVLGNYILLDKLGEGGMGLVFRAWHRRMDRIVALKVLSAESVRIPGLVERFHREAKVVAKLSHPNIVAAFDADEHQNTHFLVMEFVAGRDLSRIMRGPHQMSVSAAMDCMAQAASGFEYAHQRGIIHRDIKPGNLLLSREGVIKILDLGLARFDDNSGLILAQHEPTTIGSVLGTVDYMSPEQAEDTHAADARSDIYSLGCTLFALLAKRPPFPAETVMKRLIAHREHPIPDIRTLRHDVSDTIASYLQKMLAKNSKDRPQSMAEVESELRRILSSRTVESRTFTSDKSTLIFSKETSHSQALTRQASIDSNAARSEENMESRSGNTSAPNHETVQFAQSFPPDISPESSESESRLITNTLRQIGSCSETIQKTVGPSIQKTRHSRPQAFSVLSVITSIAAVIVILSMVLQSDLLKTDDRQQNQNANANQGVSAASSNEGESSSKTGPDLNEMAETNNASHDNKSPVQSVANPFSVQGEIPLLSLFRSNTIADGRIEDVVVKNEQMILDSSGQSNQIWIDFTVLRAQDLVIRADIKIDRLHTKGDFQNIKFAFMEQPESYFAIEREHGRFRSGISTNASLGLTSITPLPSETFDDTVPIEFAVIGNELTGWINGKRVVSAPRRQRKDASIAIACIGWRIELHRPRIAVIRRIDSAQIPPARNWSNILDDLQKKNAFKTSEGWNWGENGLISNNTLELNNLPLRTQKSQKYTFDIEFTAVDGRDAFYVMLPIGKNQCFFTVNAFPEGNVAFLGVGHVNGLTLHKSPLRSVMPRFTSNSKHRLIVTVGLDGENVAILGTLDGIQKSSFVGRSTELSVPLKEYRWPDPELMGLGTVNSGYVIHSIRVLE